jgi:hypothetical protein
MQLLCLLDTAEREPGGAAGLGSGQAATPVVVFEQQDM